VLSLTLTLKVCRLRSRRWAFRIVWLAVALLAVVTHQQADAQIVLRNGFVANAATGADGAKLPPGFTLPTQTASVKEALEEFQRFAEHEQWEKAFKSLDTIACKSSTGYVDRGDGILVPSGLLVRGLLAGLSASGKSAYRLFYDSQAAALWDKAVDQAEASSLASIVSNHLISSIGDRAADRLGDLHFEQGDMDQAIAAWRSLVDYCPESKLPQAQTLSKIATALARAERWNEFREIEQMIREKFAAENVQFGGRAMPAGEYVASLAASAGSSPSASAQDFADDFELPAETVESWQFRFQRKVDPANANQPFALQDVYGRSVPNNFEIPAAVDNARAYVNLFGVQMAFDLETGKLLWRSGKLHQLQFQQARQGAAPERYSLLVHNGQTWSVERDAAQANQNGLFALVVREAATGKEVFTTRRSLSTWSILGKPYPLGDTVYVGANRTNQGRELAVLILNAKDGKMLKTVTLGNYAVDQSQLYSDRASSPSFLFYRDRMYIDTHGGALVAMQPQTGQLDWGLLYDSPTPNSGQYYYNYQPPHYSVSGPLRAGGLLFTKGMRASRLLGVRTEGPALAWNRPVGTAAVIVAADDERIYLGGDELSAYSLKTQELLWVSQLPQSADWSTPLVTKNRLYRFTSRGVCEVDKTTGDVLRIFRGIDRDGLGGSLFFTPRAMVTVSNVAITVYPRTNTLQAQAN
jgi:outer membrane protein assembly factor BamB